MHSLSRSANNSQWHRCKMFFLSFFIKLQKHVFLWFFYFYVSFIFMFLLVLKHPHTNVIHFSSFAVILPFFRSVHSVPFHLIQQITDIGYSEGNIEWGQQTVTLWTAIGFYVCMFYACSSNVFLN